MGNKTKLSARARKEGERKRTLRNLLKRKDIASSVATVGGVGLPSKMPGTAYGISALRCATGGKLRGIVGSICEDCYAMGANYTYPSVAQAHEKRLASLRNYEAWITAWTDILTFLGANLHHTQRYHRWHDSGDLQSTEHLGAICEVARRNPGWRFWLPTKEYGIVRKYKELWEVPSNLCIRLSVFRRDEAPHPSTSSITGCTATAGNVEGFQCPAPRQEGFCGSCRKCWDPTHANTNYKVH